ncbi:hypothetical protein [Lysobacter gummosus]
MHRTAMVMKRRMRLSFSSMARHRAAFLGALKPRGRLSRQQ